MLYEFLIAYFVCISLLAVIITVYDKLCAVYSKRRVKEKTLLTVAALGGSLMMYITMQLIRHKIRKPKFMVGIPVIFVFQLLLVVLIVVLL